MLRVLGSRGASAGKLSANCDELLRVGEEALSLPEHGWATRGVRVPPPFTFVAPKAGVSGY